MNDKELMMSMHNAIEEAMQERLEAPGWVYRDITWTRSDLWNKLLTEIIGVENIRMISGSERVWGEEVYIRGSMLIAPAGMERLRVYNEERTKKKDP